MLSKVLNCQGCNEQFLQNEWRWKRITIPFFIVISTLLLMEYPVKWNMLPYEFGNMAVVILALWFVNRNIIVLFHRQVDLKNNRKGKFFLKYLSTILVSIIILYVDIHLFHELMLNVLGEACLDNDFDHVLLEHRYLFLLTILFAYFINANYERLFMFIELTETAIKAEKYKKDSVESKFNNLKNKINPHFLFNTFNALSEVIEEDPPKASKLVNELSDVYRYVLDNQELNWTPLKKELEFVYSYINLFKMRFEDSLQTDITIPVEYLEHSIAPLTLQILIENAIKHNIISRKKPLKIDLSVEDGMLLIKNNLQEKNIINNGSSFGLKNLQVRYQHLSDKEIHISKTEDEFIVKIPLLIETKRKEDKKEYNLHSIN